MSDLRIGEPSQVFAKNIEDSNRKGPLQFDNIIRGAINRVGDFEAKADKSFADLLQGKAEIHETMIALQKVDISMRLLLTIRNKAVEAYREIMRMHF
jgi:flagellar hook-basal body complex protein FliE